MAKNYTITFKSLRAATTYVVNIGGGTGTPVPLMGGSQPFTTQESDDEDMFTPIRTQSGYLRIVDNGLDAQNPPQPFDWKDLIPATDTSRPVTLTATAAGEATATVVWQGFMQAQDFGSVLYGNPQEREFPIQCVLTVTQGTDINYQQTGIQNFAYLLKQIVDAIPSAQRPTDFYIQGGADAQQWLLKKIDWQNYVSEDADGNLAARFNCYNCLEDMCAFWGWTARTKGTAMYLTCADDSAETNWLHLTYANLTTMASGTTAGTTSDTFTTTNLDTTNSGDIFASTGNDEYVQRGHNKAVVTADGNEAAENVIDYAPASVIKYMQSQQPTIEMIDGQGIGYYGDMTQFPITGAPSPLMNGEAVSGSGSFSFIQCAASNISNSAIRIKKTYNGNAFASLQTVYQHSFYYNDPYTYFSIGGIKLHGTIYQKRYKVDDYNASSKVGNKTMYMRVGIGTSRSNAKWWNGQAWQTSITSFKVSVGNADDVLRSKVQVGGLTVYSEYIATNGIDLKGLIFVDFLGSDDLPEVDGQRAFFITDFCVEYSRAKNLEVTGWSDRNTSCTYKSSNQNNIRNEWNADCIYASDNNMEFCYGVIMNPDGTPVETLTYGLTSKHPEQHLVNRVTTYWRTSKRRIATELRSNVVPDITPRHKVVLDGTTAYPISISRQWRDDVLQLTVLEL